MYGMKHTAPLTGYRPNTRPWNLGLYGRRTPGLRIVTGLLTLLTLVTECAQLLLLFYLNWYDDDKELVVQAQSCYTGAQDYLVETCPEIGSVAAGVRCPGG